MRSTHRPISSVLSAASVVAAICAGPSCFAQTPSDCYVVHGRLAVGNGAPSARIWLIGTQRILGIPDGPSGNEDATLPKNVRDALGPDPFSVRVFADFEVCPLTPDKPGYMRLVTLQSARITAVSKTGE